MGLGTLPLSVTGFTCGGHGRTQNLAAIVYGVLWKGSADCRRYSHPPNDPTKHGACCGHIANPPSLCALHRCCATMPCELAACSSMQQQKQRQDKEQLTGHCSQRAHLNSLMSMPSGGGSSCILSSLYTFWSESAKCTLHQTSLMSYIILCKELQTCAGPYIALTAEAGTTPHLGYTDL